MRYLIALSLFFLSLPALAQQQPTPSQTAIQIDNAINGWAQRLEAQDKMIADQIAKIADLQKQIDDAKAKADPAKDTPPDKKD
jgi:hypothetical protein